MSLFDDIVLGVLLVSGLIGFVRGATREVTTVVAFVVAAAFAVFSLRLTGPIARLAIHTGWMADSVAVLVVFIVIYLLLRLIGGRLARGVRQTGLSGLDRILGLGIGLMRGIVVIGGLTLLVTAATASDRMPGWMTGAKTYPLAQAAGRELKAFAPASSKLAQNAWPMALKAASDSSTTEASRSHSPDHATETTR